jgi:hypothetical protein
MAAQMMTAKDGDRLASCPSAMALLRIRTSH